MSMGSKDVAATFVGRTDYQNGVMKIKVPPECLVELKKYMHDYPRVAGGWELTLPHSEIERFNEMIVSSEWIPLTREGNAGVFTLDGEWF